MSGVLPNLPDHMAMGVFDVFQIPQLRGPARARGPYQRRGCGGAGMLIRGGAAGGGPAEDKNWRQGPLGLAEVEGQRRWAASGRRTCSVT